MKQSITLKKLMVASCIAASGIVSNASAQIHPLAFGPYALGTSTTGSNFYKDYVGLRFLVTYPSSLAGEKRYTTPYSLTSTSSWSGPVSTPIVNTQIIMPQAGDSLATSPITVDMTGKIALIYRGTNEFVCKAVAAKAAGAIACVIVNNIPGGPVGMGAGSVCSTTGLTSFPVFMISKEDGDAIDAHYRAGTDTARFTITQWGLGLGYTTDLGFVPGGTAEWHNFAIPSNQLGATGNPTPYMMQNTAFIANYGSGDLHNVKVAGTLGFTPAESSSPIVQHTDTSSLASFPRIDSIYAMVAPDYNISATGKGRFDMTYTILTAPDQVDQYPSDNSYTTSFYTTDSLYSKGRYDMTGSLGPVRTEYFQFGTAGFVWGPMYYVHNGGTALSRVQYSLSNSATGPLSGSTNLLLFKWTDGQNANPADSVMQDGELTLVSLGSQSYDGVNDTGGALLNFSGMGDPMTGLPMIVRLDANSWYYMAVEVPTGSFLGTDGLLNPYPRVFGRFENNDRYLEYSNFVLTTSSDTATAGAIAPLSSPQVNFVNSVDSFVFANQKGLIPAVAMITNNNPPREAVNNTANVNLSEVVLFPNPAKNYVNITVNLAAPSKKVVYTVLDGLGRLVSKVEHNNVQNETYTLNTSAFASGHYFLLVNSDNKVVSRNFVITK